MRNRPPIGRRTSTPIRHFWSCPAAWDAAGRRGQALGRSRWAQRCACLPVQAKEEVPVGPLDAIFALHTRAVEIYRGLLADPAVDWDAVVTLNREGLPSQARESSTRKAMAHALIHSQRHWAQLAMLLRMAGAPTEFNGDLLFSLALR